MKLPTIGNEFSESLSTTEKEVNDKAFCLEGETSDKVDGGYGWWIVLASFLMQACSFGVTSGFGVYLNYYRNNVFTDQNNSNISLIGTVAPTTIALASLLSGRLCDKLGFRVCVLIGLGFTITSFVAASFSAEIWHLILSQGFLFGLGGSLLYVPANAIVAKWFFKHRGLAVGIGTAGTGVGGSVFSVANTYLLSNLSVSWVLRINGLVIVILLIISTIIIKIPRNNSTNVKSSSSKQNAPFNYSIIYTPKFIFFLFTMFFIGFGQLVPIYYIPSYAEHIGLTKNQGAFLLGGINIASAIGRVILGFLGDRLGHVRMFFICLLCSSILPITWIISRSFGLLMFFSILYGLSSGGSASGFPSTCAALFGENHLATVLGITYASTSIGDILGPYLGGLIFEAKHNYDFVMIYTSGLYGMSAVLMLFTLLINRRLPSNESN